MPTDRSVLDRLGHGLTNDWTTLADDAAWPDATPVIVPLARLLTTPHADIAHRRIGALLQPADDVTQLAPLLPHLELIAIAFPKFRDGRGFTQARALREHQGFTGDIRAVGHTLPDQYLMLLRCGFSTVEPAEDQNPETWRAILTLRGGLDTRPTAERPLPLLRRLAALS